MILELVGFIMALVDKSRLEAVYKDNLLQVLQTALNNSDTKVLDAFYDLEKSLKCCGVNGLQDYKGKDPKNVNCYQQPRGCSSAIIELLNKNLPIIGTTLGIVLLVELLSLIGAIILAVALKHAPDTIYLSNPGDLLLNRDRQIYNKLY